MVNEKTGATIAGPYRVLDLTGDGCLIGGRLLADMGAEVVQIEPPDGSPSRIAPFYKDIPDPEKSLFWFAYCANKRGITLDITRPEGQALFKQLVKKTDVILESFAPSYLDSLNLGYTDLCKIKPDIILASITPFGQTGPKSHYRGSDLAVWAAGGYLYICGDEDSPPVWISFPQASLFGGAEAAIGAMTALWHRARSGEGQYIDVSMQECAASPTMNVLPMWGVSHVAFHRSGGCLYVSGTGVKQPIYFKCRDGYVMVLAQGGNEPFVSSSRRLVEWMGEEGRLPDWLKKMDWVKDYDASTLGQELADKVGAAIEQFTLTKTKTELYEEGAIQRQILLAPVATAQGISEDVQLRSREYWRKIPHPELAGELTYCGPFIRLSETPLQNRRRAPRIGEHNTEIYGHELGLSGDELRDLKKKGII
jgi:crotonobetainyl-CoA:carnitine CoA-transferase CaiB-like acyl-CoA transferase